MNRLLLPLLSLLVASLLVAEVSAQTYEVAQGNQDSSRKIQGKAYLVRTARVQSSVDLINVMMRMSSRAVQNYKFYLQTREIAAVAGAGEEVNVYVLYTSAPMHLESFGETLVEVSPHPFPPFITLPGANYRRASKVIMGTGEYLSLGMPKYDGFSKPIFLLPGQTVIRARPAEYEMSRQRRTWDAYKTQRDSWKRQNPDQTGRTGTRLMLPLEVRDLEIATFQFIPPPDPDQERKLKRQLRDFTREYEQVIQNINELEHKYQTEFLIHYPNHPSRNKIRRQLNKLQQDGALLELKYRLVVNLFDRAGIGPTSFATFNNWTTLSRAILRQTSKFHVEQTLEAMARTRQLARLSQSQQEKLERPAVLKRKAWEYLKDVVGVVCADPNGYARMDHQGKVIGIEFTAADFEFYYAPDRAAVWSLGDLLSVRPKKKLNSCQRYALDAMQSQGEPVSPSWIVAQVQQYRVENPTFWKSLEISVEQLVSGLDAFSTKITDILTYTPSEGSSSSSQLGDFEQEYEQEYDNRESRGIRGGVGTLRLSKPIFDGGPGSPLGL